MSAIDPRAEIPCANTRRTLKGISECAAAAAPKVTALFSKLRRVRNLEVFVEASRSFFFPATKIPPIGFSDCAANYTSAPLMLGERRASHSAQVFSAAEALTEVGTQVL
jgi:hypothetical protein